MKTAILRFTPAWTLRAFDDPRFVREYMVDRKALQPVSLMNPTPVLVDHDAERVVGHVTAFKVIDEVIPARGGCVVAPWHVAFVDIDKPPSWLKRGGGVSWAWNLSHEWEPPEVSTTVLMRGLIREVTLVSPAMEPAEPLAQVCWVDDKKPSSPALKRNSSDLPSAPAEDERPQFWDQLEHETGLPVYDGPSFERAMIAWSRSPAEKLLDEVMAAKRGLVRPGIGQVLGVR